MTREKLILEIVEGESTGRQFPLADPVAIGRDPAAEATLDDEQVSRRHATVKTKGDSVMVEDLGSLNGTYVNDQPLEGEAELSVGDSVRVGLTVFELRTEEQATVMGSAAEPAPEITALGRDVLEIVPEEELASVEPAPNVPALLAEENEPAFVRPAGSPAAPPNDPDALARLVDVRVKHQTNVAAFALLGVAALAVLIFFGVR